MGLVKYRVKDFGNDTFHESVEALTCALEELSGRSVSICKDVDGCSKHIQFIDILEDGTTRLSNGNPFDIEAWAAA